MPQIQPTVVAALADHKEIAPAATQDWSYQAVVVTHPTAPVSTVVGTMSRRLCFVSVIAAFALGVALAFVLARTGGQSEPTDTAYTPASAATTPTMTQHPHPHHTSITCTGAKAAMDNSIRSAECMNPRGGWMLPEACTYKCLTLIQDWLCTCQITDDQWWTYVIGTCVTHSVNGRMNSTFTPLCGSPLPR
eukprot:COSAG01_NODE_5757_length_4053_cov_25.842691_4_plen_191_part_00